MEKLKRLKYRNLFRSKKFLSLSIILIIVLVSSLSFFYLVNLFKEDFDYYEDINEWDDQRDYLYSTNLNIELWYNQTGRVCRNIMIDSNDDIIIAGTINGDSGNIFLIKFNNQTKEHIWNKTLSYTGYYSTPLAIDSFNNIYLAGIEFITYELKNLCLIKFDTNGTQQWIQKWEAGPFDNIKDIVVDRNDNIYLVGRVHDGFDDFFIAKYTNRGIREWYVKWGGQYHDIGTSIGLDSFGNIYVTGYTRSYGNGGADLCLIKLNPKGNLVFQSTWGSVNEEIGIALVVNSNCQIYIAGIMMSSKNPYDLVLLKFKNNGSLLWQKQWGDVSNDRCYDIALNSSEHIHVIGRSLYYDTYDSQIYVVGYDKNGILVRQGFWNTTQEDEGHAIAFNSYDKMFIGGKSKRVNSTIWDMVLLSEL